MPGDAKPFEAGQSANPGGRPKRTPEIRALIKQGGEAGMRKIIAHIDDPDARISLDASKYMVDQWIGKPVQAITGEDGAPLLMPLDLSRMTDEQLRAFVALGSLAIPHTGGDPEGSGGTGAT